MGLQADANRRACARWHIVARESPAVLPEMVSETSCDGERVGPQKAGVAEFLQPSMKGLRCAKGLSVALARFPNQPGVQGEPRHGVQNEPVPVGYFKYELK